LELASESGTRFRVSELSQSDLRFSAMSTANATNSYQPESQYRRSPERGTVSCDLGPRSLRPLNVADEGSCFNRNRRKNFPGISF
jgi:hypothetical protein